jgi:hypothetical protein
VATCHTLQALLTLLGCGIGFGPPALLLRVLKNEGAQVFRDGRFFLVPLTELEDKVPALWESVKAADSLRRALDGE